MVKCCNSEIVLRVRVELDDLTVVVCILEILDCLLLEIDSL